MLFSAWCRCQEYDVRIRLRIYEQQRIRRRWLRDWEWEKARLYQLVLARMNALGPGIARDIREWRVER